MLPLVFYNLGYEAYWQDELISYYVAKFIILTNLPFLPSGFVYPKAELYSYILAFFIKVFGADNGAPRAISGVEYLLTLALLYRVGCSFFDRRIALLACIMLGLSPHALIWARQMRMYQQAQLLTLLSVYLFYRAAQQRQRVYLVYLAVASLLVTYLSHEETFIILPALLLCIFLAGYVMRDKQHRLPSFLYSKHWWIAAAIAVGLISFQLFIVQATHPPVLGTDNTSRPQVQFNTDNIPYYFNLLFMPTANDPSNSTLVSNIPTSILWSSILAVCGCFWARKEECLSVKYTALFFVVGFLTLVFLFTMQADRYFYPLATFYYLLAAYAFMKIVRGIVRFAQTRASANQQEKASLPLSVLVSLSAALVFLSVVITPMLPLSNYNLFVSRALGLSYYQHFGDYQEAGQYVREHMRQGDIVISIIPDSIVLYYVGQSDYFFSINHALFLFEQDGHIVDTYTGQIALLRQSDFDTVLAQHARIWLISADNHYQRNALKHFVIPLDFHIVYAGTNSIVYLRGT